MIPPPDQGGGSGPITLPSIWAVARPYAGQGFDGRSKLQIIESPRLDFARSVDADAYRAIMQRLREEERRNDHKKRDKKEKDEQRKDRDQDSAEEFAVAIMATEDQLAEFEVRLNHYDSATYDAMLENEELLKAVRIDIRDMLNRAHVLPDGRRVFETEDGLRVFDEHGVELDASEITPEELDDKLPRWEAYRAAREAEQDLVVERQDLTDYQAAIAEAREAAADGKMTVEELKAFEQSLAEDMPDRVREHLPEKYRPIQELAADKPDAPQREHTRLMTTDMPSLGG